MSRYANIVTRDEGEFRLPLDHRLFSESNVLKEMVVGKHPGGDVDIWLSDLSSLELIVALDFLECDPSRAERWSRESLSQISPGFIDTIRKSAQHLGLVEMAALT